MIFHVQVFLFMFFFFFFFVLRIISGARVKFVQ